MRAEPINQTKGGGLSVRRTRVKICGITNAMDMQLAVDAGADALGFIYFEKSPRHTDVFHASWIAESPALVTRTVVLVDPADTLLGEVARLGFFHAVQLHGREDGAKVQKARDLGFTVIKAFRPLGEEDYISARALAPDLLLADTPDGDKLGGSGKTGNWTLAGEQAQGQGGPPLLLSGGLNPGNVAEAIHAVRPFGVDVSSGLEAAPGKKDSELLAAFFESVRLADSTLREGEFF